MRRRTRQRVHGASSAPRRRRKPIARRRVCNTRRVVIPERAHRVERARVDVPREQRARIVCDHAARCAARVRRGRRRCATISVGDRSRMGVARRRGAPLPLGFRNRGSWRFMTHSTKEEPCHGEKYPRRAIRRRRRRRRRARGVRERGRQRARFFASPQPRSRWTSSRSRTRWRN